MNAEDRDDNISNFGVRFGSQRVHEKLANHESEYTREALASNTEHKPILDKLMKDKRPSVRKATLRFHNHKDHIDAAVHDPDFSVRGLVAYKGHHHDTLVHDHDDYVRTAVASAGSKPHHDILMHDESPKVRMEVAQHGHNEHRDNLMHDENWKVRERVARFGNDKHRDHLVHDSVPAVREAVAEHGNDSHHQVLKNDFDSKVQFATINKTKNPEILDHMSKHSAWPTKAADKLKGLR
jgi:hypothetical protein